MGVDVVFVPSFACQSSTIFVSKKALFVEEEVEESKFGVDVEEETGGINKELFLYLVLIRNNWLVVWGLDGKEAEVGMILYLNFFRAADILSDKIFEGDGRWGWAEEGEEVGIIIFLSFTIFLKFIFGFSLSIIFVIGEEEEEEEYEIVKGSTWLIVGISIDVDNNVSQDEKKQQQVIRQVDWSALFIDFFTKSLSYDFIFLSNWFESTCEWK